MDFINFVITHIRDLPWGVWYHNVRLIGVILDVVLVALLVFSFRNARKFRPPFIRRPEGLAKKKIEKDPRVAERFRGIMERSQSAPPHSWTLAIIDADKCVDDVLRQRGIAGEQMADRLAQLGRWNLKTLDSLWRAHRLRNQLVHTPDFEVGQKRTEDALATYEAFLKEIEAI